MPLQKQIIIAVMVLIIAAVGLIVFMNGRDDTTTESRLEDAQAYYDMLDYDKAISIYNNILSSEKDCTEAYIGLANSYIAKGNEEKAVEVLERGLSNSGNDKVISGMLSELSGDVNTAEKEEELSGSEISEASQSEEVTSVPVTEEPEPGIPVTETEPAVTETAENTATAERPKPTQEPARPVTSVSAVRTDVEMPNFIGMDKDEAVKLADEMNIRLILKYDDNDMYANDLVYHQSHRAGSIVPENTEVEVYVSVNENTQAAEDSINIMSFYSAAKQWGELNSDKVRDVSFNEGSRTVTINAALMKNFVIDESVAAAFAECENAVLVINSSSVSMAISSSSVTKSGKLDLSANVYGNDLRLTLDMGASGSLNCTASVTVFDCNIHSDDLDNMSLYYNNKKSGSFRTDIDGNPVITVSSGGQYTIR